MKRKPYPSPTTPSQSRDKKHNYVLERYKIMCGLKDRVLGNLDASCQLTALTFCAPCEAPRFGLA